MHRNEEQTTFHWLPNCSTPVQAAAALRDHAFLLGSGDNISVIVYRLDDNVTSTDFEIPQYARFVILSTNAHVLFSTKQTWVSSSSGGLESSSSSRSGNSIHATLIEEDSTAPPTIERKKKRDKTTSWIMRKICWHKLRALSVCL